MLVSTGPAWSSVCWAGSASSLLLRRVPSPCGPWPQSSSASGRRHHRVSGRSRRGETEYRSDPAALAEGQALFRGLCSGCHGGAGRGGKGPDLTDNRWIHGSTDQDIARVIQNGVPKTTMKKLGDALKPDQIRKLIAYIRSLARSPGESTWKPYMAGDPQAGRKIFFDPKGKVQCAKCHSVGGEGGRIGPALDRIASRRAPSL